MSLYHHQLFLFTLQEYFFYCRPKFEITDKSLNEEQKLISALKTKINHPQLHTVNHTVDKYILSFTKWHKNIIFSQFLEKKEHTLNVGEFKNMC